MRHHFVKTTNHQRFMAAVAALDGLPPPPAPAPVAAQPTQPARRGEMPTAIRDTLKQFSRSARAAGAISSTAEGDA